MGRKRWACVLKSERSRIMTELARRPRGRSKSLPESEMSKFTTGNQGAAGIVNAFDAAVCERNLTQRKYKRAEVRFAPDHAKGMLLTSQVRREQH